MILKYLNNVVFILFVMIFSNNLHSQDQLDFSDLNDKFIEANNLYNESKYEKSIELYYQILDSGFHSAELYFNLGNSFYKLNDIANSILFYEKSLKLNSNDKDVINNLKMVNNAIIDDITKIPEPFIESLLNKISNVLSFSTWFLFVLFILIGTTLKISFHAYEKNYVEQYAIIFSTKTEIKAEPNERSENLLNLHLGTKVKIIDSFNEEWVKIKLVNGQEGWINIKEIKII